MMQKLILSYKYKLAFYFYFQQAKVIKDSIDFKVGTYCGGTNGLSSHLHWEKELQQYEVIIVYFYWFSCVSVVILIIYTVSQFCQSQVFVMTPQILLRNFNHCFIKMELIALLIFDECHHAQAQSNHPYAEIMKVTCCAIMSTIMSFAPSSISSISFITDINISTSVCGLYMF